MAGTVRNFNLPHEAKVEAESLRKEQTRMFAAHALTGMLSAVQGPFKSEAVCQRAWELAELMMKLENDPASIAVRRGGPVNLPKE